MIKHREIETKGNRGRKIVLTIQTGFFFGLPGTEEGLHGPYTFNSLTAHGMATKFTQNDVLISSNI